MVTFNLQRAKLALGCITLAEANLFASNINFLVGHRIHNPKTYPARLDSWLQLLSDRHREQLGGIGLVSEVKNVSTVAQLSKLFLEDYDSRKDIVQSTKTQFRNCLNNRFPLKLKQQKLKEIEPKREIERPNAKPVFSKATTKLFQHVESWQREHYSKSSWSRANGRIREMGKWAVEQGIVDHNPFSLLTIPGEVNQERNEYIETEIVEDAIDQCFDSDVRLLFVLGRYCGLRLPSEARTMKWSHIDWDKRQLHILDSKKKKFRTMPLFDRVAQELNRQKDETGDDRRLVLTDRIIRTTGANSYTLMVEAIERAGVQRWERLCQNLRTRCENHLLMDGFDERVVSVWVGHTVKVSRKHYQKQTDKELLNAAKIGFSS